MAQTKYFNFCHFFLAVRPILFKLQNEFFSFQISKMKIQFFSISLWWYGDFFQISKKSFQISKNDFYE
jgi:hypothetical protein